jgi:hypothetical protein
MPEAVATTKRKFYRALDSLSNPSTTRVIEPAAKRIRRSVSTSSSRSRVFEARKAQEQTEAAPTTPPNFSPWSHETFLARLKTYSKVSLWHSKPDAIGEVQWAKRGWICIDVNTVACRGGCERRVVVSLDVEQRHGEDAKAISTIPSPDEESTKGVAEDDDADMETALVRRYEALIVEGHTATCMWRKAGCQDDIYRLQVIRPAIWLPALRSRYDSLHAIRHATNDVTFKDAESASSGETAANDLLRVFPDPKALHIALHGWQGSRDAGNELLQCEACFQRIGLWMYQPGYKVVRAGNPRVGSGPNSDEDGDDMQAVDLLELHRDHCPWRNGDSQKASGSFAGLNASQILRRVITTYAREQKRKMDEQRTPTRATSPDEHEHEELESTTSPAPSREEVKKQDAERESKLQRLKSLFAIKRKPIAKAVGIAKVR